MIFHVASDTLVGLYSIQNDDDVGNAVEKKNGYRPRINTEKCAFVLIPVLWFHVQMLITWLCRGWVVTLVETKKPAATPPHRQQGAPPPVAAGAQANTVQVSGLAVGGLDKVSMGSLVVLFEQHGNTQIPPLSQAKWWA